MLKYEAEYCCWCSYSGVEAMVLKLDQWTPSWDSWSLELVTLVLGIWILSVGTFIRLDRVVTYCVATSYVLDLMLV